MNPEQFERIQELFERVCDEAPAVRAAILEETCGDDDLVRREVELLCGCDRTIQGEPPALRHVAGYRILRLVGYGGMGSVYEALQESPRRRVALKTLRPDAATPELLARFRREAQVLGRLQHVSIAQIFELGEADFGAGAPQPYFAMELVEGLTLTDHANERRLDRGERLRLFVRVCDAVDYAHRQGIVHRDLKPENVLVVDSGDETDPIGRPKVLDFGVARILGGEPGSTTLRTRAGQLLGTLAYMSPEQGSGELGEPDARSDVYSLGVLLFELLSGALPIHVSGMSLHAALAAIQHTEPERLSRFDHRLRGDLETIAARALAKEPSRRYASAADLAADLTRHLRNEPIVARPASALYTLSRFSRRHRGLVVGLAAAFLALSLGLLLSGRFAWRAQQAARAAEWETYCARLTAAAAVIDEEPLRAQSHLDAAPANLRGWEWSHLVHRIEGDGRAFAPLLGGSDPVGLIENLAISGDERHAAAAAADGRVAVWDVGSGRLERVLDGLDARFVALPSAGPPILAVACGDDTLRLHDVVSNRTRTIATIPGGADKLAWDPSGRWLGIGGRTWTHGIRYWSEAEGLREAPFPFEGTERLNALDFTRAGDETLGAVLAGDTVCVWSPESGRVLRTRYLTDNPRGLAFAAGASRLVIGTWQRVVLLLDTETLEVLSRGYGHTALIPVVSGREELAATAARDDTVRLWDVRSGRSIRVLRARTGLVSFFPESARLAYADAGIVRVIDVDRDPRRVLRGHSSYVYFLAWSADGRRLATATRFAPEVFVWDVETASRRVAHPLTATESLAFLGDGDTLLQVDSARVGATPETSPPTAAPDPAPDLWPAAPSPVRLGPITVRSPDGRLACTGEVGRAGDVSVRRVEDGGLAYVVPGLYWGAAFSPDSEALVLASDGGCIEVRDAHTGVLEHRLPCHGGQSVFTVDFHPDGRRLASGGNDGCIQLWDTDTWQPVLELRGHDSYVKMVAFSPDGRRLASASGDFTVRLWEAGP